MSILRHMTDRPTDTDFNGQSKNRRGPLFVGSLVFGLSFLVFLQAASSRGILYAPPVNGGDEDSYERLGYNLASGMGFGYCPADSSVLTGLIEPRPTASCEAGCTSAEFALTAYRPPGFPILVAVVYRFSPLNFFAVRVINCFCCAFAVALSAAWFSREFSTATGLLAGGLCCADTRLREFAGTFLTENLATLMLTFFVIALSMFLRRRSALNAGLCGLSLSALVFTRSFYVAWYPVLWIAFTLSVVRQWRRSRLPRTAVINPLCVFFIASLILTGPWWIRNCLVLNSIMPTGTQGGIGIADGFSDSAFANFGSWTPATANRIADEMRQDPSLQHLTAIEFEREHARRGAAHASSWIRLHPELMPQLAWWKLSRLWEFGSIGHAVLFAMMTVGMMSTRRHSVCHVLLLLLVLNSVTVMATYHTYERFMTPFRPMIHGMVACGIVQIAGSIRRIMASRR